VRFVVAVSGPVIVEVLINAVVRSLIAGEVATPGKRHEREKEYRAPRVHTSGYDFGPVGASRGRRMRPALHAYCTKVQDVHFQHQRVSIPAQIAKK
jgi:hypothetical protein